MRRLSAIAVSVVLALSLGGVLVTQSSAGRLPPPARADCGRAGVAGAGFTVYECGSGGGGTRYSHPAELLVVRTDGSYTGYPDAFSQANLVRRSAAGEIVAAYNDSIVRIRSFALTTLVDQHRLKRLYPGNVGLAAINALTVNSAGDIFLRANYYASHRRGCANVRAERTAAGRVLVLGRSATGETCG